MNQLNSLQRVLAIMILNIFLMLKFLLVIKQ